MKCLKTVAKLAKIFIWRIDFMGPFPKSHKFQYLLVATDYVSKWAEAEALCTNNAQVAVNFLKSFSPILEFQKP